MLKAGRPDSSISIRRSRAAFSKYFSRVNVRFQSAGARSHNANRGVHAKFWFASNAESTAHQFAERPLPTHWAVSDQCNPRDFARLKRTPASRHNGIGSVPSQPDPFNMSLSWTSSAINENEAEGLIPASDARVSARILMRCGARLSFETEAGSERTIKGRVVNMSSSGVLVEAPRPMAVGSQVRLRANELLVGTAYVRHSTRRSWRFRIGLEFATPVRNRY